MTEQIAIDWILICLYTGLFMTVAILLYRKGSRILGFVIEPAPRFWAVKKWTAVFLLLLPAMRIYSNPGIPSVRRWIGRIAAAFGLLASLLGLCASSSA